PAFAKLFVETQYDDATGALFARRRPRAAQENPVWAVHVSSSEPAGQVVEHETDRLKFLGRGRSVAKPAAFDDGAALSRTTGPVLDPIFSLCRTVALGAGGTTRLAFVTGTGDSHAAVRAIAERFSSIDAVDGTFAAASERYQAELQDLKLTADQVSVFNQLIG